MNTRPTVSDTKRAFYSRQTRPVNSVYRRVIEELLVEMHLLRVNDDFRYDAIYALGIVTSYDNFMEGYEPASDREPIFAALTAAEDLDPQHLRSNAEHLGNTVNQKTLQGLQSWVQTAVSTGMGEFEGQIKAIADNPSFKYSRLFGIGLYAMLAKADEAAAADEEKVKGYLTEMSALLGLSEEKLAKDIELYRSNLEKVQLARQTMAEIVAADRKREAQRQAEQQAKKDAHADGAADAPTNSDSSTSDESNSAPSA